MRIPWHLVVVILGSLTLAVCSGGGDPRSAQERREDEEREKPGVEVEGEEVLAEEDEPTPATPTSTPTPPTVSPSGESSEILSLDMARSEGEYWVNMLLAHSIFAHTEKSGKAFEVWFHRDGGGVINLSYNLPAGGEPTVTSFCVGELSEECPGGVFPVRVEIGEDGIKLTFYVSGDSFPDPIEWRVSASVETEANSASEDPVRVDFQDGQRFPIGTDERDPY
jgi:hypothetical protein